jgi:hypothetical protein
MGGAALAAPLLTGGGGGDGGNSTKGSFQIIPMTPTQTAANKQLGYLSGLSGFSLLGKPAQSKITRAEKVLQSYILPMAKLEQKHASGQISDAQYETQLASWNKKQAAQQLILDAYQPEIQRLTDKQATETAAGTPDIPAEKVIGMTDTEKAAQEQLTKYATTPFELSGLEKTGQLLAGQYANSAQRTIPGLQVSGLTGTEQTIQDQLKNLAGQNLLPDSFTGANSQLQSVMKGKTEQELLNSPAMKAAQLLQSKQLEDANTSTIAANRKNIGAGGVGRLLGLNKQNETINLAQELGRQADIAQQAQMQALNLAPTYFNFEQFAPTQKLAGMQSLAQIPRTVADAQNQASYNQQMLQQEANIQDLLSKMGIASQYGAYARQQADKDTAAKLAMVQQFGSLPRQLEQAQSTADWQAQMQNMLFPYQTQAPMLQSIMNQQMYAYQPPASGGSSPLSGILGSVTGSGAGSLLGSLFGGSGGGGAGMLGGGIGTPTNPIGSPGGGGWG